MADQIHIQNLKPHIEIMFAGSGNLFPEINNQEKKSKRSDFDPHVNKAGIWNVGGLPYGFHSQQSFSHFCSTPNGRTRIEGKFSVADFNSHKFFSPFGTMGDHHTVFEL